MRLSTLLSAVAALLLMSGAAGTALSAMPEEQPLLSDGVMEMWSGPDEYCLTDGPQQLQSMAVPVSMMECANGGRGASTCQIRCNRMFGFYYSNCAVECIHGYYACCNCNDGAICHCYLDHAELWPISPRD
jgi:hypothetical protein